MSSNVFERVGPFFVRLSTGLDFEGVDSIRRLEFHDAEGSWSNSVSNVAHERRQTNESARSLCPRNKKNQNAPSLDKLRSLLLAPPIFKDDDANSATFKVPCSQLTPSTECAGAKVDGMRSGFREVSGFKLA